MDADGRILWDPTLPGMSRTEREARTLTGMNRVMAALRSVDPLPSAPEPLAYLNEWRVDTQYGAETDPPSTLSIA
jgi:aminoglycoside phosphotransferase (APT) family kinase protein